MSQTASHLVHHVILQVSLRGRELSAPIPLRVLLATRPNVVTPALHATAPSRTTTSPLPTTPQRRVNANDRNGCAPLRDSVCADCTAAMRSVASTCSWPAAGAASVEFIGTLPTASPYLQRPLWSRQIEKSYDRVQSVLDLRSARLDGS
jgi:hypothetical protein